MRMLAAVLICTASIWVMASDGEGEHYSPFVGERQPNQLLWGDTHLHTSLSADANLIGNIALSPAEAYRFARGEIITTNSGQQARLERPLDFLVVSDHAEFLGVLDALRERKDQESISRFAKGFFDAINATQPVTVEESSLAISRTAWQQSLQAAEEAYLPGQFTTLAGFEWTSMPAGDNLHRVVIFRDDIEKTAKVMPYSALDSTNPRDLWSYLADYEQHTGGSALAIPHNGNVSNGLMFNTRTFTGEPIGPEYASERRRWEPIVEVTQIKGDSETHPLLSPDDEFADYGTWDQGNLAVSTKEPWMLKYEYARSALRTGLELGKQVGVNPFQFGMIGSTDSHTSLSTPEEDNFWGKSVNYEPGSSRRPNSNFIIYQEGGVADSASWVDYVPSAEDVVIYTWEQLASGYAAVWATDNSREAIFDAMRRKEVYATTGSRIALRFFAGWDFEQRDADRPNLASIGYRKGVPMGAELKARQPAPGHAPQLLIAASKDPSAANLDRVQVIKGWLDASGTSRERVYDVVWSGDRQPDDQGKLPPILSTVQKNEASYLNSVGAAELATVWTDPDFDPDVAAFYYVRVLEIPTPRWNVYDEHRLRVKFPPEAPDIHQERAYSSPIWYSPSNS